MILECEFYSCLKDEADLFSSLFPIKYLEYDSPILPYRGLAGSLEPLVSSKQHIFCQNELVVSEVDYLLLSLEKQPFLCVFCYSNYCVSHLIEHKYISKEMLDRHIDLWMPFIKEACSCSAAYICSPCIRAAVLYNLKTTLKQGITLNDLINKVYDEKERYEHSDNQRII